MENTSQFAKKIMNAAKNEKISMIKKCKFEQISIIKKCKMNKFNI